MEEVIRIPDDRIGVLIGPNGEVKRRIIKETKTSVIIDSASGEVVVEGEGEGYFKATDIVKAIGRGFSPQRAFTLLKKDFLLKIIHIPDFVGGNASAQKAKRGRIIGKEGLARKEIEKKTNSQISVFGKTVAIIANIQDIENAEEAVELLLKGSTHETLEHFLENKDKKRFEL